MSSIAVLGAGAFGCALSLQLHHAGNAVRLWTHNHAQAAQMLADRRIKHLPEQVLPAEISITADFSQALAGVEAVLICVPSHAFEDTLIALSDLLDDNELAGYQLAFATKGFYPNGHQLLHQRVAQYFPYLSPTVLSGPTFANEVAQGLPTAIVAACTILDNANYWAEKLHHGYFRVYTHDDVVGVEVGGAVKNVMAIAAGISDGLGFGANARAALISRALAETMRLGMALGARAETLMGLTGLGDLVLTCTDNQSRNRRFGLALAQGQTVQSALITIGTVEGVKAVKSVILLAQAYQCDVPIAQAVDDLLNGVLSPRAAVAQLLSRAPKSE
jgi:glycerol-3-phosphate dehydrogenase (NAD(P)+)